MDNLPEFVETKLRELSTKLGMPYEDVVEEFMAIFSSDFIQKDPQFKTDDDRYKYTLRALRIRLLTMPPVKKYTVIPVGYSDERLTKRGQKIVTIFALVYQPGKKPKLKRIIALDRYAEVYKQIELFAKYDVKLGENRYGDLVVDSRTRFEEPEYLGVDPVELMNSLNIPVIPIAEAAKHKSLRGADGYLIETDWRGIRGIVARKVVGKRKDGTNFGLYIVGDESIDIDIVQKNGQTAIQGFPVFCPVHQMRYAELSECYFFGTIDIDNRTGEPFMNCYLIIPIHPAEEEDFGGLDL